MLKKTLLVLLAFTAFSLAQTQPRKNKYDQGVQPAATYAAQLQSELIALRDAALTDDYAYQQVSHLAENIGGRPPGSPQAEAAVNYVADEMRKLGLDVHLEEVKPGKWVRGTDAAELVEYPGQVPGTTQKVVLTALGGNTPTPSGGLTGRVVVVNNFQELNALGRKKVAGNIVLFNYRFDHRKALMGQSFASYLEAGEYRVGGAGAAAELGAIASLVRSVGDANYRLPHTGYSTNAGISQGAVTSEDADLIAHLASQGNVRIHLTLTSQTGPPVLSHNVVADIKGSEHPEEIVIVSGHLDSWDLGTGAIDDGAGVAMAMETAELLQKLHLRPKRTLRVIAWMDEENGGAGHDAYALAHQAELAQYAGAIESDSGAGHPLGFLAKMNPAGLPLLKPAQAVLAGFGASLIQIMAESPGSDIEPLSDKGVPALGVWEDNSKYFEYHHTAADTLDKINPQELRENAAAMAVMGYALASMPERLPR